jgi:integrase
MKKTDKVNFNASMKFANDNINVVVASNPRKESSQNALGLLVKICLKTSMRVSDILDLEYSQFSEDKNHPNTFILVYKVKKAGITNTVPINYELMQDILKHRDNCIKKFKDVHPKIFFNYHSKCLFTRVWASNKIADANKKGLLGSVVNVAGTHSLRKAAANELFDKTQDLKLAKTFLGHKNILTTSIYLEDSHKSTQDKLRELLC